MSSHLPWAYPGLPMAPCDLFSGQGWEVVSAAHVERRGLLSTRLCGAGDPEMFALYGLWPCSPSCSLPISSPPFPSTTTAITTASVTRPSWILPLLCHQRKLETTQASGVSSIQGLGWCSSHHP